MLLKQRLIRLSDCVSLAFKFNDQALQCFGVKFLSFALNSIDDHFVVQLIYHQFAKLYYYVMMIFYKNCHNDYIAYFFIWELEFID